MSERHPLSARLCAGLLIGTLGTFALILATASALYARKREQERRAATGAALERVREFLRGEAYVMSVFGSRQPPMYGQGVYFALLPKSPGGSVSAFMPPDSVGWRDEGEKPLRDGWGTPIRAQIPGPLHRCDAWSCGPNGVDEHGSGDDILIGEDMPKAGQDK